MKMSRFRTRHFVRFGGVLIVVVLNILLIGLAIQTLYNNYWHKRWFLSLLEKLFTPKKHMLIWLISTQIIIVIIGLLGCIAALSNIRFLIMLYSATIGIILIQEMNLSIFCYVEHFHAHHNSDRYFAKRMYDMYANLDEVDNDLMDRVNIELNCCGVKKPLDVYVHSLTKLRDSCCKGNVPCMDYSQKTLSPHEIEKGLTVESWIHRIYRNGKEQGCFPILEEIYFSNLHHMYIKHAYIYPTIEILAILFLWLSAILYYDVYGDADAADNEQEDEGHYSSYSTEKDYSGSETKSYTESTTTRTRTTSVSSRGPSSKTSGSETTREDTSKSSRSTKISKDESEKPFEEEEKVIWRNYRGNYKRGGVRRWR